MRVLICGDREWDDPETVFTVLDGLWDAGNLAGQDPILTVIDGHARGADMAAHEWAEANAEHRVEHGCYPADWETHGKAAGPIRNQTMLTLGRPDVVWAFHDDLASSKGTKDMVTRARKAGVPVYLVSRVK